MKLVKFLDIDFFWQLKLRKVGNFLKFKFLIFGGIFATAFLIFTLSEAQNSTICSFAGPDLSSDLIRLTDFVVSGSENLKVGDAITVSFKLQNFGQSNLELGLKGIFVAGKDPENSNLSFGFTRANTTFEVGETIKVSVSKTLDKAGTWKVWPSYHLSLATGERLGPEEWHACTLNVAPEIQDSDKDGIPDNIDKCPLEPETFNQYQDDDGCPDEVPEPEDKIPPEVDIVVSPTSPTTLDKIQFEAKARDSSGIKEIRIFINDEKKIVCKSKCSLKEKTIFQCSDFKKIGEKEAICVFEEGPFPAGKITFRAEALDGKDNFGISLTKEIQVSSLEIEMFPHEVGTCLRIISGQVFNFYPSGTDTLRIKVCRLVPTEGITTPLCDFSTISFIEVSTSSDPDIFEYQIQVGCSGRYLIEPVYLPREKKCKWYGSFDPERYILNVETDRLENRDFHFEPEDLISLIESRSLDRVPCGLEDLENLPSRFDWRDFGLVSPIKDQADCGSCWAFATVGMVESVYNVENLRALNPDLSEQNLVSNCYPPASCFGRNASVEAGLDTLEFIKTNGIVDEDCFPYQSGDCDVYDSDLKRVVCRDSCSCSEVSCSNPCDCNFCSDWTNRLWRILDYGMPEIHLARLDRKKALLRYGPLEVCGAGHCVVLIGWDDSVESWIIKNSWGIDWEDLGFGYVRYRDPWRSERTWVERTYYVKGIISP